MRETLLRSAAPDRSFRSWRYWGKCFGGVSELENEQNEKAPSHATAIRRNYDAETEKRVREWILDCSMHYGQESATNSQHDDLSQNINTVCSNMKVTEPDKDPPTLKIATATVNNKVRNKNRWKGRLPSVGPAESHSISLPTDSNSPPQVVQYKLQVLPQPPVSPVTSELIFINELHARGNSAEADRMVWMRRSAALERRRSSRISAQPASLVGANAWLVPVSYSSTLT
jgi:hypothetical protein